MSQNRPPPQSDPSESVSACSQSGEHLVIASRRRLVLRSLNAAGVVAAGALPTHAHAYFSGKYCIHPYTGKNHQATVSGCHSVILSLKTGNTNVVKGHRCQHYKTKSNWPAGCNNGYGLSFTPDSRFCDVFRCDTANYRNRSLLWLCVNRPNSDEAHWATAVANAKKRTPFAYTQKEVVDFYKSSRYSAALTFFKDFCETES